MQTEIEAKWLRINPVEIRQALKEAGAVLTSPERLMIRYNFDYPDMRLGKVRGWVRVRNEGDIITLSYKQLNDRTIHGTKEASVTVNDVDATCSFLKAIGLKQTSVQETRRESWKLGNVEIEIDTWPWIPPFIEIEAKSEDELFNVAERIGLSRAHALHGSVEVAYQATYDVTESEIDGWKEIRFTDTPDWLLKKVKSL